MSWVRIDDGFSSHPKVVGLSDAAFRCFIVGLCHAGRYLTDGAITDKVIPSLATADVRAELVEAGLWDEVDGAVVIHDYLEYNPSRSGVEAERQRKSDAGKRGAAVRWQRHEDHANGVAAAMAPAIAEGIGTSMLPSPAPTPERPDRPVRDESRGNLDIAATGHALRLFAAIRDGHKDEHTRTVILSYASKLPPAAFEAVREDLERNKHTIKHEGKWVNAALQKAASTRA